MKILLLLSVVVLSSMLATAQKFSAGITSAAGKAWTNDPESYYYRSLGTVKTAASYYGVQLLLRASGHVYVESNIVFSKEGFGFGETKKPNYVNVGMEYVRLTLQPVYYPLQNTSVIQPKVSAGISGGYLLDGQSDFTDGNANELGFKTKEIVRSRFDFGYRLEAGIDVKLNPRIRLTTGTAYYHGLMTVPDFDRKWKNKNITYSAGVLFRTSRK